MAQSSYLQKKWVIPFLVGIFLLGVVFYGFTASQVTANQKDEVTVQVTDGMTADKIGQILEQKGLFPSATVFRVYAKIYGLENSLQAGDYVFTKDMSIGKIVSMLSKGDTAYQKLTIPEGYTVEQIAQLLDKNKIADGNVFKKLAKEYIPFPFVAPSPVAAYKAEGYLFPDTYRLPRKVTEKQLLEMLAGQFGQQFTPEMQARARDMGLSIRDVVILASLVEKEAAKEADRPVIAGVFLNRLKQSMPLQSCATIQYILGDPKAELSVQDTEIPSPYNNYLHQGLPPGPIANPGIASIQAVLHPAATDYLYFVADRDGFHHFSRTYEEHLAMIAKVQPWNILIY